MNRRSLRVFSLMACAAGAGLCCGCAGSVRILSSSSGAGPLGEATVHWVHVGEQVDFKIDAPQETSYVIMDLCGERMVLRDSGEGYRFTRLFDDSWRDRSCQVRATAYRQMDGPDIPGRDDSGQLMKDQPKEDRPDEILATAVVQLRCYQSQIRFRVRPVKGVDLGKAVLKIFGPDNRIWVLRRAQGGQEGFTILGPEPGGAYVVFYEPRSEQINRSGTTRVVFSAEGDGQKRIFREIMLQTP